MGFVTCPTRAGVVTIAVTIAVTNPTRDRTSPPACFGVQIRDRPGTSNVSTSRSGWPRLRAQNCRSARPVRREERDAGVAWPDHAREGIMRVDGSVEDAVHNAFNVTGRLVDCSRRRGWGT